MQKNHINENRESLAVIGISLRLPGANNKKELWSNLINGVESIRTFTEDELMSEPGFDYSQLTNKYYIPAKGYLSEPELFAYKFFKFSKLRADITSPQFRIFIECVWEALEDAGLNIDRYPGKIGVYATSGSKDSYYEKNILGNKDILEQVSEYELFIRNANDFLATTIAYQFNFKGPCINIQTACSSSLVAICKACEDLRQGNCDVAIVGGVSIKFPTKSGYVYKEGMIYSNDGHCKAFSKLPSGIVPGDGGGVVVLKRLTSAEYDKDHIYSIIKGVSVNNDGMEKLSYTAPSINGQLEVLRQASENAQISPATISYIEAHGTGTKLGDEIELTALKEYLSLGGAREIPCYIGTIKPNIGHLDVASGMAGFIKTVLSIKNKLIPKTLYCDMERNGCTNSNESIRLAVDNVFWSHNKEKPRRAGVSSFGVGGTNAHVIMEEYNEIAENFSDCVPQIIVLSAKNKTDLDRNKDHLIKYLVNQRNGLPEIALTLQQGRKHFEEREAIICENTEELIDMLYFSDINNFLSGTSKIEFQKNAFLFDRAENSETIYYMKRMRDDKIISTIWPKYDEMLLKSCAHKIDDFIDSDLKDAEYSQKVIDNILTFVWQVIMTNYWLILDVIPNVVFGVGVGEYTAAHIAGILSFNDVIRLIEVEYQEKIEEDHKETLLVMCSHKKLQSIFSDREFSIISIETKNKTIITVDRDKFESIKTELSERGILSKRIKYNPQYINDKTLSEYNKLLDILEISEKKIECITARGDYTDKLYWQNSLRSIKNTYKACRDLLKLESNVYIEISFGSSLSSQLQQVNFQFNDTAVKTVSVAKLPRKPPKIGLQMMLAKAWVLGVNVNWNVYSMYYNPKALKVSLPGYVLEREECLISHKDRAVKSSRTVHKEYCPDKTVLNYIYLPLWKQRPILHFKNGSQNPVIIAGNNNSIKFIKDYLTQNVDLPRIYTCFSTDSAWPSVSTEIFFEERARYWHDVLANYISFGSITILYTHSLDYFNEGCNPDELSYYYDLVSLGKAMGRLSGDSTIDIIVLTNKTMSVTLADNVGPVKSSIVGPVFCLPEEYNNLNVRLIDLPCEGTIQEHISSILSELFAEDNHQIIAYRNKKRYAKYYLGHKLDGNKKRNPLKFRNHGVYVITGGLGGIGLEVANHLAVVYQANIILLSRTGTRFLKNINKDENKTPEDINIERQLAIINGYAKSLQVYDVNVSDHNHMMEVVETIESSIGKINGVIHAAAIYPNGLMQQKKFSEHQKMFEAKINGLMVLDSIFQAKSLDFMILFSSLSSARGAMGSVDYIAANNVINTYSELYNSKRKFPVISVAWDAWKETGMRKNYLNKHKKEHNNYKQNESSVHNYNLSDALWIDFILEHRYTDNKMVIPATVIIEMLCKLEIKEKSKMTPKVFENIFFMAPGFIVNPNQAYIQIKNDRKMNKYEVYLNDLDKVVCIASATVSSDFSHENDHKPALKTDYDFSDSKNSNPLENNRKIITGKHWGCRVLSKRFGSEHVAQVTLPEQFCNEIDKYILHPSMLDVAMNTHTYAYKDQYLPFLIEKLTIYSRLQTTCFSSITVTYEGEKNGLLKSNVIVTDSSGNISLEINNFVLKKDPS